jgi:hydrogenase nickel incorporation protein HypA/HybF
MHELSIASSLAAKVLAFAEGTDGARVLEVTLEVGEMTCIQTEQLTFCYGAITTDTPIEGSALIIERVPLVVSCPECGYTGRPKYWEDAQWDAPIATLACPRCGRTADAIRGHECSIKSLRYDRSTQLPENRATG